MKMTERTWEKVMLKSERGFERGTVTIRGGYNHIIVSHDLTRQAGWDGKMRVDAFRCGDELMLKPADDGDLLAAPYGTAFKICSAPLARMLNRDKFRLVKFSARVDGDAVIFNVVPLKAIGSVQ